MSKLTIKHVIDTVDGLSEVELTPMRAIRYNCLDCSGFDKKEVRECQITHCPLWPYRFGHGALKPD